MESVEQPKTRRQLRKRMRELHAEGMEHAGIASTLSQEGFLSARGKPLTAVNVSHYMRNSLKLRKRRKRKGGGQALSEQLDAPKAKSAKTNFGDIEDIMTSNLPDRLKMVAIKAVITDGGDNDAV